MRLNRSVLFCCLILFPFLFMILINETHEIPATSYNKNKCNRYCHSKGCLHTTEKTSFLDQKAMNSYVAMIAWLKESGTGMNYREMNLALYVLIIPFFSSLLLWGVLRKL